VTKLSYARALNRALAAEMERDPARRITRPDGAILGFAPEPDLALQPDRQRLLDTVLEIVKGG
jgi:hypothetical protein